MGGLSKKAQQISMLNERDRMPAILLDAGNLLFRRSTISHSQEVVTATGLMHIYQQMAYDAVAVGPNDLAAGLELLRSGQEQGFPWLSANLTDKHRQPLFPAAKIIERGGMKIGIIGLTGQPDTPSQETLVADWRAVLPAQLDRLGREARLTIVLSSLSAQDNAEITRLYPQTQLLITADGQQGNLTPRVANSTLVTQTMNQGKYLGVLSLDWIPGGTWPSGKQPGPEIPSDKAATQPACSFSGNFIPLGKHLPEDPRIATLIEDIKAQISAHNRQAADRSRQNGTAVADLGSMTGALRCQECHPRQTEFWLTTAHARSYSTLQQRQQNFNFDCLPCHVTGQAPAGAKATPPSVEVFLTLPASLQSVGCESCHGPGQAHSQNPQQVNPGKEVMEATCRTCHTRERDPLFNYRQKISRVSCPAG